MKKNEILNKQFHAHGILQKALLSIKNSNVTGWDEILDSRNVLGDSEIAKTDPGGEFI